MEKILGGQVDLSQLNDKDDSAYGRFRKENAVDWNAKLFGLVPLWVLLVLGIGLLLFTFRGHIFRGVGRGVRRAPWLVPVVVVGVMVSLFWPVMHRWWTGGGGVTVERSIAISVPLLVLAIGTIFIWLRRQTLTPEGPGREVRENNALARLFVGNPTRGGIHVSQFGLSAWAFGFSLVICATGWIPAASIWMKISLEIIVLGVMAWFFIQGYASLAGNPPHRAVYLFLGARTKTEYGEGLVWLFPGLESLAPINMTKRDYDIKIADIRTSDMAQMEGDVQMPWKPDGDNLSQFLESGSELGIQNLAEEYLRERVREFFLNEVNAREGRRKIMRPKTDKGKVSYEIKDEKYLMEPWEVAQAMKNKLILRLILQMVDIGQLDDAERVLAAQAEQHIQTHTDSEDDDEKKAALRSINGVTERLRDVLRKKGCPDRFHWGIRILDINIGTILPAGKTKEAADLRAQETAKRHAAVFRTETEALQTFKFLEQLAEAGVVMEFPDAYRMLMDYNMTRDGHGFAIPGIAGPIATAIGVILSRVAGGK